MSDEGDPDPIGIIGADGGDFDPGHYAGGGGFESAQYPSHETPVTAEEFYNQLHFKHPDDWFNKPAPDPRITFTIGAILCLVSFVWWVKRVGHLLEGAKHKSKKEKKSVNMNLKVRVMISAAIDNDKNLFAMVTYTAVSFLILWGIQLNYQIALKVMFCFYFVASSMESIRVILAYKSVDFNDEGHGELVFSSELMHDTFDKFKEKLLEPKNVYEDMGRKLYLVCMIFVTQVILISFVCIDMTEDSVTKCLDGTAGCPVGGTLGSWCFFVLGIFMALVFQLGPKTNFGESEQNPTYWLRLFLAIHNHHTKITWVNNQKGGLKRSVHLQPLDYRVVIRFLMSFLINGVGFHILVHALPLQIASQSSLTAVVFRAVGMMYLVDLDDTPGYKLTIVDSSAGDAESPMPNRRKMHESFLVRRTSVVSQESVDYGTLDLVGESDQLLAK